ncbi:regulator of volume decrease after cellular swelling-domain-containing protein [Tricladium varicosporioides]|nr:regulator of volume decrease after cellular swelling-domain-containing protein [Hymenoscyphus varicosporioides]
MPPTTIHNAPPLDSFTPLSEHQSHTPSSFFSAKPVLHFHGVGTRALAAGRHVSKLPIFADAPAQSNEAVENDATAPCVEVVDAYISSENLTLFNPSTCTGISIPYPAISLHAIQRLPDPADSNKQVQGLYMQLEFSNPDAGGDDEEDEATELTLIPPPNASDSGPSATQLLFDAVSNCSNLHPDPSFEDDGDMGDGDGDDRIIFEGSVGYEGISGLPNVLRGNTDGGLPPPFPGSGGWITAENVSEFFDDDGNYIGGANGESLGEGAGTVRLRDDEKANSGVNGNGESDSTGNKRARTD